jgi:hypothetical protein
MMKSLLIICNSATSILKDTHAGVEESEGVQKGCMTSENFFIVKCNGIARTMKFR